MSKLHFYMPDDVEMLIRVKAKQANLLLSKYLAEIFKRETGAANQWPADYFALFDEWQGEPQQVLNTLPLEKRQAFN